MLDEDFLFEQFDENCIKEQVNSFENSFSLKLRESKVKDVENGFKTNISNNIPPLPYSFEQKQLPEVFRQEPQFKINIFKSKANFNNLSDVNYQKFAFDELWTEKYRPTRICDLVGNEQVTLELIKWVSQWSDFFKNTSRTTVPEQNIVLLSGPPGVGKTTLASIVTANANFQPNIINASDERNEDSLISQITSAYDTKGLFGEKKQFFIFDEIDGAYEPGIIRLVQSLAVHNVATADTEQDDVESSEPKSKKSKSSNSFRRLLMPIICICNDLYATSLRNLRSNSYSLIMKKVHFTDTVKRLEHICHKENVYYEGKALISLAELYDGDIRSCLNCLQMSCAQSRKFTFSHFQSISSSNKDSTQSIYSLLNQIFHKDPKEKSKMHAKLLNDLSQLGEEEKVINGCFENYLRNSFVDISLQKTCILSEWFQFHDLIDISIAKHHNFSAITFQSVVPCAFHHYCSSYSKQEMIRFPKIDYENYVKLVNSTGILNSLKQNTVFLSKRTLRLDLLAFLVFIIEIPMKISNISLLKPSEKKLIENISNIMRDYGINYIQRKDSSNSYKFRLNPPLENLVIFNSSIKFLVLLDDSKAYHIKQIISNEISKQNIQHLSCEKSKDIEKNNAAVSFKNVFSTSILNANVKDKNQPIWYKYQEGCCNSVKKPLKVRQILSV